LDSTPKHLFQAVEYTTAMGYDIERYLSARRAYDPRVGPSGEVAFAFDATGVPQVWRLDAARSWPTQLTFSDETVSMGGWSPTRPELVFGMDEGGDERTQLHRLAGDGSETVNLTRTPDAKHLFCGWSHDGDRIAFASDRHGGFDVYVQRRDETGDDATRVTDERDLIPAAWSPDGDRLLAVEVHSNFHLDLYVVGLSGGSVRAVEPFDEPVRYGPVEWSPTGDAVYAVTDGVGDDTRSLARIDLDGDDATELVDGGGWDVEEFVLHHDTGRVAYTRNVDGYSEVTVTDLDALDGDRGRPDAGPSAGDASPFDAGRRYPEPALPDGVVGDETIIQRSLDFGPDADRLAVSSSTPTSPPNVYVVDVHTGDATRWTDADTAGVPARTLQTPTLARYESFDSLDVPAFVSTPADGDPPHPLIVDVHGGPEGQRKPSFDAKRQFFLASGYAVFEPNVRGSTGYGREYASLDDKRNRMDAVRDVAAGVEWLCDAGVADPDRVAAYGHSYGGFVVLACLTEFPDLWAAGVDEVGVANFVTFLESLSEFRRQFRESEYGSLDEDREFLASISPITNIDRIDAPLLVLHGANDPRVPVEEAEQIIERASNHVPVESVIFDDEGHRFEKRENRVAAYRRVVEFFDEHV
jgi:dipeptidyl aminopeptidase/acylaminoacyl peptidase